MAEEIELPFGPRATKADYEKLLTVRQRYIIRKRYSDNPDVVALLAENEALRKMETDAIEAVRILQNKHTQAMAEVSSLEKMLEESENENDLLHEELAKSDEEIGRLEEKIEALQQAKGESHGQ